MMDSKANEKKFCKDVKRNKKCTFCSFHSKKTQKRPGLSAKERGTEITLLQFEENTFLKENIRCNF